MVVTTASTPGRPSTASASIESIRPRAMVDCATQPYASPARELGGVAGLPGHLGDPLDSADRHAHRGRERTHEVSKSSLKVRTIRFCNSGIL